jgi:hypothetical protein
VRARIAIGAALLALVAGLAIVLSESRPERTGVNGIPPAAYVAALRPGQKICQPSTVAAGTSSVGLTVGTYGVPGPPLQVGFTGPPGSAGSFLGRAEGGYAAGRLSIPVPPVAREASGLLCIRNAGASRVALAGATAVGPVSTLDGRPSRAALQLEYLRGTASAFGLGSTVARRVGLLRFGDGLLWALVALMAATVAATVALALREIRE